MFEGGDDRDVAPAEQLWDLQQISYHSAGSVSSIYKIQSHCEKVGLNVPITVLEGLSV